MLVASGLLFTFLLSKCLEDLGVVLPAFAKEVGDHLRYDPVSLGRFAVLPFFCKDLQYEHYHSGRAAAGP